MSIMPLLPTRLVSNLCFRIYTKKGVGVIHLCSSRRSSLACFPVKNEKYAEAHAYMATSLVPQRHNGRVVSIRRHLLRLLMTGL